MLHHSSGAAAMLVVGAARCRYQFGMWCVDVNAAQRDAASALCEAVLLSFSCEHVRQSLYQHLCITYDRRVVQSHMFLCRLASVIISWLVGSSSGGRTAALHLWLAIRGGTAV
jgi:hypothetical protein